MDSATASAPAHWWRQYRDRTTRHPRVHHVNFHVDCKKGFSFKDLVNLHITRYTANGQQCLYVWDKVSGKPGHVVFDNCKNDRNSVRAEAKEQIENYIKSKGRVDLTATQQVVLVSLLVLAMIVLMALITTLPVIVLAAATTADPNIANALLRISRFLS